MTGHSGFYLICSCCYISWFMSYERTILKSGDILNTKQNTQKTIALCKAQQKKKNFLQ